MVDQLFYFICCSFIWCFFSATLARSTCTLSQKRCSRFFFSPNKCTFFKRGPSHGETRYGETTYNDVFFHMTRRNFFFFIKQIFSRLGETHVSAKHLPKCLGETRHAKSHIFYFVSRIHIMGCGTYIPWYNMNEHKECGYMKESLLIYRGILIFGVHRMSIRNAGI